MRTYRVTYTTDCSTYSVHRGAHSEDAQSYLYHRLQHTQFTQGSTQWGHTELPIPPTAALIVYTGEHTVRTYRVTYTTDCSTYSVHRGAHSEDVQSYLYHRLQHTQFTQGSTQWGRTELPIPPTAAHTVYTVEHTVRTYRVTYTTDCSTYSLHRGAHSEDIQSYLYHRLQHTQFTQGSTQWGLTELPIPPTAAHTVYTGEHTVRTHRVTYTTDCSTYSVHRGAHSEDVQSYLYHRLQHTQFTQWSTQWGRTELPIPPTAALIVYTGEHAVRTYRVTYTTCCSTYSVHRGAHSEDVQSYLYHRLQHI